MINEVREAPAGNPVGAEISKLRDMSAPTLMTWAEFEQLPKTACKQELIRGELSELPPAKKSHQIIIESLYELLRTVLPKGRVHLQGGYRMNDGWLIPDVSVAWPEQPVEGGYDRHSPMIAIEVISPANTANQMQTKVDMYFDEGAAEVWVVYPVSKSMMVYTKKDDRIVAAQVKDVYRSALVDVDVRLSEVLPAE